MELIDLAGNDSNEDSEAVIKFVAPVHPLTNPWRPPQLQPCLSHLKSKAADQPHQDTQHLVQEPQQRLRRLQQRQTQSAPNDSPGEPPSKRVRTDSAVKPRLRGKRATAAGHATAEAHQLPADAKSATAAATTGVTGGMHVDKALRQGSSSQAQKGNLLLQRTPLSLSQPLSQPHSQPQSHPHHAGVISHPGSPAADLHSQEQDSPPASQPSQPCSLNGSQQTRSKPHRSPRAGSASKQALRQSTFGSLPWGRPGQGIANTQGGQRSAQLSPPRHSTHLCMPQLNGAAEQPAPEQQELRPPPLPRQPNHAVGEGLSSCPVPSPLQWREQHAPQAAAALAVQPKKVQELQGWLSCHQPGRMQRGIPRVLLLTGPPGCGKTATLRALAVELGFDLLEWTAPTPTLWSELQLQGPRQGNTGPTYTSKLDDFEAFVARAKFPTLALSSAGRGELARPSVGPSMPTPGSSTSSNAGTASNRLSDPAPPAAAAGPEPACGSQPGQARALRPRPKLLLLEDLPHAHDQDAQQRLCRALRDLCGTARCPVVIEATQASGAAGAGPTAGRGTGSGGRKGLPKAVLDTLERMHAGTITFNALTGPAISKALLRVAAAEHRALSTEAAAGLATHADGDLRQALQTLHLLLMGSRNAEAPPAAGKGSRARKGAAAPSGSTARKPQNGAVAKQLQPHEAAALQYAQRDVGLDLFHALGKLLYNKRDGEPPAAGLTPPGSQQPELPCSIPRSREPDQVSGRGRQPAARAQPPRDASGGCPGGPLRGLPSFAFTEALLHPSQQRPAMRYDPEGILNQSGLEPLSVTSFLHANYLSFVDDDNIDIAAAVSQRFSDAAYLSCIHSAASGMAHDVWGDDSSTGNSVMTSCAGAVAARGILYETSAAASVPKRWLPLQGPVYQVSDRACAANSEALHAMAGSRARLLASSLAGGCGATLATEVLPCMRVLASSGLSCYLPLQLALPACWSVYWQGQVKEHRTAREQPPLKDSSFAMHTLEAAVGQVMHEPGSDVSAGQHEDDPIDE